VKSIILAAASAGLIAASAFAQDRPASKSELRFDHYRDYDALVTESKALAAAHPALLAYVELGKSVEGRPLFALILNNPKTGPEPDKPAMYIDGNIHGNEIQASETVLYTVWYLVENYGKLEPITRLVDRTAFYFVPCANPDGRQNWFDLQNSSHSSRTGYKPTDDDNDGVADEDGPDDLDGDGSIGIMWRRDPNGTHRRSELDPNEMELVDPQPRADGTIRRGDWSMAGMEGIDNDGDGQVNEDGPGGYDMNRNWPAGWNPDHVQGGAGDWPFSYPETDAIGRFIMTKANIAAGQAYHNAGGMILRGPGVPQREDAYSGDRSTYEVIGRVGEQMLPGYRLMVIHSDLYPVHGGFVTWLAESLGVITYTNELWTDKRISQNGGEPSPQMRDIWQDHVLFGQTKSPLKEVDHPTLGKVLVGGGNKWSSRIPPAFMLEEECHRNMAFTLFHANEMPRVSMGPSLVRKLGDGLWEVTLELKNDALIPTRTARSARSKIGVADRVTLTPASAVTIAASGTVERRYDRSFTPERETPRVVVLDEGVPGRGSTFVRFLASGPEGAEIAVAYTAEKAIDLKGSVKLAAVDPAEQAKK
jgi:Zinc carboxypeptidase